MKKVSTLAGIITIVVIAIVIFGGVFAWQYFTEKQMQSAEKESENQKILSRPFPLAGEPTKIAPVQNKTACNSNWQCEIGTCNNGHKNGILIDLNNCGQPISSAKIVCPNIIKDATCPLVVINFPNNGEVWKQGQAVKISWASYNLLSSDKIDILIDDCKIVPAFAKPQPCSSASIAENLSGDSTLYSWVVPPSFAIATDYEVIVLATRPNDYGQDSAITMDTKKNISVIAQ